MPTRADVCVVGVGCVGGIMAKELASAGLSVVGLEAGPDLPFEDYAFKDSLRKERRSPANNNVGGGLMVWTGSATRFMPGDFKVHTDEIASRVAERAGAVLDGTQIIDWPIGYDDLEPYYEKFEWEMGISGLGGANPFEGPRRRDYPMPPIRDGARSQVFGKATVGLGYHPYPTPCAVTSRAYQPPAPYDQRIPERPACTYCGQCNGYGCHVEAKLSTAYTAIPVALETGNFDLRTNCRVFRIDTDSRGKVTGVSYFDQDGRVQQQEASVVVLGAQVNEHSRLLLNSGNGKGRHPGLANSSGMVGRGVMAHSAVRGTGWFDDFRVNAFIGPNAGMRLDDFNGNNFDHTGLGFIRGATIGTSGGGTPLEQLDAVPPGLPRWGERYKESLAHYYTRSFGLSMMVETLPHRDNFIDIDPAKKNRRGVPAHRVHFSFHENERRLQQYLEEIGVKIMTATGADHLTVSKSLRPNRWAGGVRMGADPSESVLNGYCQTHDNENLFIIGASAFPTMAGYAPTPTIGALTYRTADYIKTSRQLFS
jgi:gluconate 2-dehydrogenase alpha chain